MLVCLVGNAEPSFLKTILNLCKITWSGEASLFCVSYLCSLIIPYIVFVYSPSLISNPAMPSMFRNASRKFKEELKLRNVVAFPQVLKVLKVLLIGRYERYLRESHHLKCGGKHGDCNYLLYKMNSEIRTLFFQQRLKGLSWNWTQIFFRVMTGSKRIFIDLWCHLRGHIC